MTTPKNAPAHQIASFTLAVAMTVLLLFSVGAQADSHHADALASAQAAHQPLCAAAQRSARG